MKYTDLYKLRPRLETIYNNKISKLEEFGFDTQKFKSEITLLDGKIDKIKLDNNSMIGEVEYDAKDNKLIDDLNALIDDFEQFIDQLLIQCNVFKDFKDISNKLNGPLNDVQFDRLVSEVLDKILTLNELKKLGWKFNEKTNFVFKVLYGVIKKEYQLKGTSLVHKTLINMELNTQIYDLILEDNKEIKKEVISLDEIDIVFTIALNENNYKNKIIQRRKQIEKSKKVESLQEDEALDSLARSKEKINSSKKEIRKSRKNTIQSVGSLILSIGLLSSGLTYAIKKGTPETKTYFKTDKACYDTIDGTYTTSSYTEEIENAKVLKVYSEADKNGKRTLRVYSIEGDSIDPEDYIDYEVSEDNLLHEYKDITDSVANNKSTDEFSVVEITTNVDEENVVQKTSSKGKMILYCAIVTALWIGLEILFFNVSNEEIGVLSTAFGDGRDKLKSDLNNLFVEKRRLRKYLEEKLQYDKEIQEHKDRIEEYIAMDEELTKKYYVLFKNENAQVEDENEKELILKKE